MGSPAAWEDEHKRMENIRHHIGCLHGREGFCKPCDDFFQSLWEDEGGSISFDSGDVTPEGGEFVE